MFGYKKKDDYGAGRATDNSEARIDSDIFNRSKAKGSKKKTGF